MCGAGPGLARGPSAGVARAAQAWPARAGAGVAGAIAGKANVEEEWCGRVRAAPWRRPGVRSEPTGSGQGVDGVVSTAWERLRSFEVVHRTYDRPVSRVCQRAVR